ncbi:glycoside hydrolase family 78 protein [Hymenobacter tibetensis]|uniref:alpha-L-rhamnosidase n=1 Tax=Hymenobacter tibetensis TaxID=497967 RepID=A0ABY4D0C0_9BACT|nr:alpha-L-rhamnosidase [Hymenobacter tibetensis]UOG75978.1 glycoside hydrolase family 78 protein [Hymenobacter tibetensis]
MNTNRLLAFLCTILLLTAFREPRPAAVQLQRLRCELLTNPEGIDVTAPRLSWEVGSPERNLEQTAYQVLVASTPEKLAADEGDLWNSGKVNSGQSVHVAYAGAPLRSRAQCYWKVRTWTNQGETAWSTPARWSVGLLNYLDWKGRWIGFDRAFAWDKEESHARLSARYFRKEFKTEKPIKQATAYIIGLGLYELYVNGQRVGEQVLAPGPTDYTKGVKYNTYDVTPLLKQGPNALGTVLGNGRFYAMRQNYKPYKIKTFGYPKLLMQLEVTYADGTRDVIKTDDTWQGTADGPIRTNNEYDGEEYDATKEMPSWSTAGFDAKKWLKAELVQEPGGAFEAQMNENMKVMETIKPVSIKPLGGGKYILDMGQNMVGWLRLRTSGPKGQKVTLRFAETLQKSGELYVANLRDARVTDVYTLKGGGRETWEPTFVFHGFRYAEISNWPGATPTVADFDGRIVYDDIATTGEFTTSDATINQVYKNAYWGIRGNYKGMPIDCPQRNERQPWLGDRTTGAYGESFVFDNARLYAKWLTDIEQAQKADGSIPDVAPAFWRYYGDNVTWPGTYLTIADMLYRQYGDAAPLTRHYESMKRWLTYMRQNYSENGLITKDKYGDWCVPPESKELIHSKDPARNTDGALIASSTYYHMLGLMQGFAKVLDKPQDAQEYAKLAADLKTAFNQKFLNKETCQYSNGTVTANLLPLAYGLVPEEDQGKVFQNIADKILVENKGHISTGVIGTQWLMRGLTEHGRPDIALRLATNRDYPSWGYMAANGATTIWELWNGNTADPAMNSQNHVMLLGDLLVWYYENLAGIKSAPDAPGFQRLEMKPTPTPGLTSVQASYHSVRGLVKSSWKQDAKRFTWNIAVPGNTKALVYIPAKNAKDVQEGGKKASSATGVKFVRQESDRAVFEVGSGDYAFEVK